MVDLVEKHLDQIRAVCCQYNVKRLEIFGSAVTGEFDTGSDIDFLVEFGPLEEGHHADTYFGLLDAIKGILDRNVDLVMSSAIKNPYFLEGIENKREVLYAA